MTLEEIKNQVREYYYMEDDSIIDVSLACIIANRLQIGDPTWLIIIGASSGGKSQILRPLAMTDTKFIHRVDDITENTFLSGAKIKGGETSLLKRIGPAGIVTISDLTVLFSRNMESRNAILSQFRMLYDGEMNKAVGNSDKPIHWKGYLGMLAGSTPSIYANFEEVADMGERFMYFRMHPYDEKKATQVALSRNLYGKELDEKLSEMYAGYIKEVVVNNKDHKKIELLPEHIEEIINISIVAEKIRTTNRIDKVTKEIERIPTPAMPMRTALQLMNLAKALKIMRGRELNDYDIKIITWLGMSLANEEKRAVLHFLAGREQTVTTKEVADHIGLSTRMIGSVLQNLASTKIVNRISDVGSDNSNYWKITDDYIRQMFLVTETKELPF